MAPKPKRTRPYDAEKRRQYAATYSARVRAEHGCSATTIRTRALRRRVLKLLGDKCVGCGCSVIEILDINHVHGGGCADSRRGLKWFQRTRPHKRYKAILRSVMAQEGRFDLRCKICNVKHWVELEFGVHGHTVIWE